MKTNENVGLQLRKFFEAQQAAVEKRGEDLKAFNERIRTPDFVIEVQNLGFWRVDDGIVQLTKYKNGYHPDSLVLYDALFLEMFSYLRYAECQPLER